MILTLVIVQMWKNERECRVIYKTYTFFLNTCPAWVPDLAAGQILRMCVLDSKEQRDALKLGFVFLPSTVLHWRTLVYTS